MGLENVYLAFGLTLLAGLSTGFGSIIAFFAHRTNTVFLSVSLGFSAGVMIYISLVEMLGQSVKSLSLSQGAKTGSWIAVLSFFGGMAIAATIDKLVPSYENPHEARSVEEMDLGQRGSGQLMRMGVFSALAIGIHNFPEGLATFTATLKNPTLGISIAIAIAIHNIPEGIAVSVPIYYATGNKRKAFVYSFLSGIAEPLGALVGFLVLLPFFNDTVFGVLFAAVAGIMVFISFDELLPTAEKYGKHHQALYGLISGMAVMAVSLILFI